MSATVMAVAGTALLLAEPGADLTAVMFAPAFAVLGLLSVLVVRKVPANGVGWLMFALAWVAAGSVVAEGYIRYRGGALPGAGWLAWLGTAVLDTAAPLLLVNLFLFFPTGRLASRRWRPVFWTLVALTVVAAGIYGMQPVTPESYGSMPNPVAVAGSQSLLWLADAAITALVVGGMVVAVAGLAMRYRSASGVERAQIRWVALAAAILALELVVAAAVQGFADDETLQSSELVGAVLFLLAFLTLPVAITIAITRYRLYDIDRIIRRTVTYAVVVGLLGLVYAGSVVTGRVALRPVLGDSDVAVALSTLVVAALFQPSLRRVRAVVDRRFDRRRYDAQRTVESFGSRLRDEVVLDQVAADLRAVVARTLQPASLSLWLRAHSEASG